MNFAVAVFQEGLRIDFGNFTSAFRDLWVCEKEVLLQKR